MKHITVGQLVAELQKVDQTLPVLVGCHYDNDDGVRSLPGVRVGKYEPAEAAYGASHFFTSSDEPTAVRAAVIS